jgi:Na+/alanine symporter
MNKSLKIVRFAALALTVAAGLGIGHAYAGVAAPIGVGGPLHVECFYCESERLLDMIRP